VPRLRCVGVCRIRSAADAVCRHFEFLFFGDLRIRISLLPQSLINNGTCNKDRSAITQVRGFARWGGGAAPLDTHAAPPHPPATLLSSPEMKKVSG
jgi:hypothetical protein